MIILIKHEITTDTITPNNSSTLLTYTYSKSILTTNNSKIHW